TQRIGEELSQETGTVGNKGFGGDVPAEIDAHVGVARGGAADDVGETVAADVARRYVDTDSVLGTEGVELNQEVEVGVGRVEGPSGSGGAVEPFDRVDAVGGPRNRVVKAMVFGGAPPHRDGTGVVGAVGGEVVRERPMGEAAILHAAGCPADDEEA